MSRLLREPLLHFVLLGALLFGAIRWIDPEVEVPEERRIRVTSAEVERLVTRFVLTWKRPPSEEELLGLVDDHVLEEIYYRRALEMGIDRDDPIIRRHLRQKLEFFTESTAALVAPTDVELADFLAANTDRFRRDPTYTFRQIYFDPARHGPDPEATLAGHLADLNAGGDIAGDPVLIPATFSQAPRRVVDSTFGPNLSVALDRLELNVWSGPVRSGLGLHLVLLEERQLGELPPLDMIREAVTREWAYDRQQEIRRRFNDRLLEDYEVTIDWPQETEGVSESTPSP